MTEKFQKKKLNRDDHRKMENMAKNVKKGGVALATAGIIFAAIKEKGLAFLSAVKDMVTKA